MRSIIIDFYIEKDIQWCQLIFSLMEMIIIRDNRETYAASKCSLTSVHYHYQQRLLVLEKGSCSKCLLFRYCGGLSCVNPDNSWCYCFHYFNLSSCSPIHWLNIVHIACVFVQERQQITSLTKWLRCTLCATSAIRVLNS